MKHQFLFSMALISNLAFPLVLEAKPTKGWYTMDAMGCMILRECNEGVVEIKSHEDLHRYYGKYLILPDDAKEFDALVQASNKVGVKVYLAPEKYFPPGHRGVYHTVSNNFYLNASLVKRYSVLMSVVRHEGWHAAQDCMAGTIENSLIALIYPEETVPDMWRKITEKTYADIPDSIPWESEATWAGKTEGMTAMALAACADGKMWEVYEPTPLTRKWLIENGYIKE